MRPADFCFAFHTPFSAKRGSKVKGQCGRFASAAPQWRRTGQCYTLTKDRDTGRLRAGLAAGVSYAGKEKLSCDILCSSSRSV